MNRKLFELYVEHHNTTPELNEFFCRETPCSKCKAHGVLCITNINDIAEALTVYESDMKYIKENYPEILI